MRTPFLLALLMAVAGCASQPAPRTTPVDLDALTREVAAAETAAAEAGRRADWASFAANCRRFNELVLEHLRQGSVETLIVAS